MKAMTLAAGLGTRLRPFSLLRPKPLFPVLDTPLLRLILNQLRCAGFGPIIVNAHHLSNQIASLLQDEKDCIIQQEDLILGTGGGLRQARAHFGTEPVLVTNGDIYHTIDLAHVYRKHCASGSDVTLVLHDYPRFNNVIVAGDGRILGFGDGVGRADVSAKQLAFTGIHVLDPALLESIPFGVPYNIIDCYREVIDKGGSVRAFIVKEHFWTDIGTPGDYFDLHAALLKGKTDFDFTAPPCTGLPCHIAESAIIGENVRFADWVSIGSGARIGDGASLARVVVWDGAEVLAAAELCDTIVT
jgi:mannose-1-phosphate guanylyltransferase